jgi:3-oxoacyl-[acyl-carrier protein] reductase
MGIESRGLLQTSGKIWNDTRPLVFFGLGVQFHDCYSQLVLSAGREPDFLCDNASDKWGKQFFGKRCISSDDLGKLGKDTAVVITVRRYEDIHRQLSEIGMKYVYAACFDRGYDIVRSIKAVGTSQSKCESEDFVSPVTGRWTLVTGAARGIGRQIALEMARLGSNIIAHSRQVSHTEELIKICRQTGVLAEPVEAELGNPDEVERMLDRLEKNSPPVDIIFNNAGISLACGSNQWDISSQEYMTHYAVNTVAPVRICYRLIPSMMRRGFGRVINISSTIQKRPGEMAYSCSKAALSKFVHDLAPSLEGSGVTVSLTCPGYVRSDMGGPDAPHPVESVIPGALLGALLDEDTNGRWIIAQDYAGLSLPEAIKRAKFYYS